MPNRNMLGVRIHWGQGDPPVEEVEFTVDDLSLLDALGLRGQWVRPLRSVVSPPSDHLLGGPDRWVSEEEESFQDGRVAIAGCGCGDVGCAALAVRVTVKDDEVTWSDLGVRRDERIIGKVFRFNPSTVPPSTASASGVSRERRYSRPDGPVEAKPTCDRSTLLRHQRSAR